MSSASARDHGKQDSEEVEQAANSSTSIDVGEGSGASQSKSTPVKDNGVASTSSQNTSQGPEIPGSPAKGEASSSKMHSPGPSESVVVTRKPRPIRKRRLPSGTDAPKSILKPAPPPQKPFSFRRDILQNLNTRLAQQGVNVQVPMPQSGSAQGAATLLGGMFKRIGGMAAGAAGAALGGTLRPEDQPISSGGQPPGSPTTARGSEDRAGGEQQGPRPISSAPSAAAASLHDVASRLSAVGQNSTLARGQPATRSNSSSSETVGPTASTSSSASSSSAGGWNLPAPSSSAAPLKRVQFNVSSMSVVYPISADIPIEDEDDTRKRIEGLHRQAIKERKEKRWRPEELEMLYRECCRVREEHPLKKMRLVFEEAARATPPSLSVLDLSNLPLDRQAIDPIADLLSVDFGLSKLVLENCGLADDSLKAILHALLVSGTLPNLSLANNRRIRYNGWRFVAIFMRRARALRYLDLSENAMNRASLEHIADAIRRPLTAGASAVEGASGSNASAGQSDGNTKASQPQLGSALADETEDVDEDGQPLMPPALLLRQGEEGKDAHMATAIISLRMENCGLKGASLALLAQALRFSNVKHLSLRRNRINQMGAVALAIMLKDYPDSTTEAGTSSTDVGGDAQEERLGRSTLIGSDSASQVRSFSPMLPEIPIITSSPAGGMTARRAVSAEPRSGDVDLKEEEIEGIRASKPPNQSEAEAIALFQAKRAKRILDTLPRLGNLVTVDLKGNDLRGGVTYLAHVLRKNRTLRVLNLSDNNVDMHGLVALAEALKYNSTLETLDVSHNPCAGPGVEGITTLRTAFALNSNLKRLFMNHTDLSSDGAIALAEFLPEARSLIHLDLTENFEIDIAGVMALAVSVKMNKSLRCLDLNIPPNDPDFARLSQDILQSCIRNTQSAQRRATQKGLKQPVAAPIYKSVVARAIQEQDEREKAMEAAREAERQAALATQHDRQQTFQKLVDAAEQCLIVLRDLREGSERTSNSNSNSNSNEGPSSPSDSSSTKPITAPPPADFVADLTAQSQSLRKKLSGAVASMEEGPLLERALKVNDELESVVAKLAKASFESTETTSKGKGSSAQAGSSSALERGEALTPAAARDANASEADVEVEGGAEREVEAEETMEEAEKEPDPELQAPSPNSSSPRLQRKARHMVDEEGEIFRRAKSLQAAEEQQEGGAEGAELQMGPDAASQEEEQPGNEGEAQAAAQPLSSARQSASSATSAGVDPSSSASTLPSDRAAAPPIVEVFEDNEATGDDLKRSLLSAEIPREPSPSHAS